MTTTKHIKSMEDYRMERRRLKATIAEKELLLRADINEIQELMKPVKAASKFVGNFITSKDKNEKDLIDKGVENAITFLLRNVLLARADWVTKTIVPIIAKNYATNKLDENRVNIVHTIREWLHKYQDKRREATLKAEKNSMHYDRSTADTNL